MVTKYPLREFRILFFNDGANNSTHAPDPRDGNLHIPLRWWIGSCMLPGVSGGFLSYGLLHLLLWQTILCLGSFSVHCTRPFMLHFRGVFDARLYFKSPVTSSDCIIAGVFQLWKLCVHALHETNKNMTITIHCSLSLPTVVNVSV